MALSNTAVPRYYGKFREAVIRGEIPVCKEISMEMNRIDDLIANPGIYYDDKAVEGWIKYCEAEMTLTDGSDLHLLDSFKLWGEQVFGWYYFVERTVYEPNADGRGGHYVKKMIKKRLVNKQYLIVGRGAAKSIYDSCIQSFFENVDTSTTHQITTAPTMKLAEEVMSPIRTAITRARGPVFQFLTQGSLQNTTGSQANRVKLASTKKGIENFLTGSLIEIRPMSINKLQGLRCKIATVDEWLSGDIREDVIGAIEQGASKVDDYLIVATSSEGTVRNGAGDTIKMELMSILKGDYPNPHVSIWWYKLDSVDEVGYPEMWMKANPNIGKTVSYETYQLDVERAEKAPAARNDILAKRFGLPMEGYTYYFTYEETLPHRKRDYWQMACALGGDLSQGDDFCSFTFLFPLRNGSFGVKTRNYITSRTLNKLPAAMRNKYEQFMDEGIGPDAIAQIKALNNMSDSELEKYADLWKVKHAMAREQAVGELEGLREETQQNIAKLREEADQELTEYRVLWQEKMNQVTEDANAQLEQLRRSFEEKVGLIKNNTEDELQEMADTAQKVLTEAGWDETGKQIVKGLTEGVQSEKSSFVDEITQLALAGVQAAKSTLDIHSPSRVFREIGNYTGLGFVKGLQDYADRSYAAGSEMAESAEGGLSGVLQTIADIVSGGFDMEPVIRPVLDLSAVSAGADALNNLFYSQRAVGLVGQAAIAFEAQRSGSSQTTISVDNDDVVAELRTLRGEMASMLERMEKLRVVLNTGALVGELAEPMDVALGQRSTQRGRGI